MSIPGEPRDCIVYDGLIVPPCDLLPCGRWMTPDELRELLEEYGKDDPEVGRAFLVDLMLSALSAIRDGHDEPHKLAHAVLRANTADFLSRTPLLPVSNEDGAS